MEEKLKVDLLVGKSEDEVFVAYVPELKILIIGETDWSGGERPKRTIRVKYVTEKNDENDDEDTKIDPNWVEHLGKGGKIK